jgi:O-antigen/teichoic acid export membrane protein
MRNASALPLIRTIAVLGFGRVLARLLMAAAIPLLARLYDAEAFGLFGVYNSAATALSFAAALCYDQGIVPAKSDDEAAALLYLSLLLPVGVCLVLQVIAVLCAPLVRDLGSTEAFARIILLLPAASGVNATLLILLHWANRSHLDRLMSSCSILRAGLMVGLQLGGGWLALGGMGLVIGQLGATLIAAMALAIGISWPALPCERRFLHLRNTARSRQDFAIFSFPRALLEAGAGMVVTGLLTVLFGPANVGLYWMAYRIVSIPSQILDEPLRQVFYRAASLSLTKGEGVIRPLVLIMGFRAAILIPFITLVVWSANGLFVHLLGPSWLEAAFYAKLMATGWVVSEIATPLHALPVLLERQKFQFVVELIGRATQILIPLIAYLCGGFALCVGLLSVFEMLFAIGFGMALFWPKAVRALASGRVSPKARGLHVANGAAT